ncbi:MAG TPA: hypothetical protein VIU62_00655 [Chloroflexota bacterium]|jgi:hypothetical protein
MSYEQRFRAVGRLIDEGMFRDVCVTEIDDGVIVCGVFPLSQAKGVSSDVPISLRFSKERIEQASAELNSKHNRAWFGQR